MKAWWIALVLIACGAPARGRIGYVVTATDDTPSGRAAVGRAIGAGDDVSGDGFVMRLDDAGRARVAATAGVAAVRPIAADEKLGKLPDTSPVSVRIDLYDDATPAELDAVAAWIAAHGGSVGAKAARSIDATIATSMLHALAETAEVRWIEALEAR
jgi:hypothetical protein